jgi:cellulose synthase (UDP-forming)
MRGDVMQPTGVRLPAGAPETNRLWRHRGAPEVRAIDRVILGVLVGAGLVSVAHLADWWFRASHVGEPLLFALLSIAFWYGISRIVLGWVNVLALRRPAAGAMLPHVEVAIFVTSSPGEPIEMFEVTLAACARLRHAHTTYLLDDTGDPRFAELAARHGAVRMELCGVPGAKAGKINRALERTDEPFILVLDPDHVPFPEFLDRVLGHFDDPRVGFVQVAQAYYNQSRSFTAAGAAEQTYAFYGPGLMGLYGHDASVAIGANCTFRRSALASIGGHAIGLAEDLLTAIRLHAAGWRSVYVPEIVSRGLVPEDLGAFFTQQLKWSRGVYELFFAELPRRVRGLRWRQRLSYLTIATYYACGITTAMYLLIPYLYLWTGRQPARMPAAEFIVALLPVGVIGAVIYVYTQRWLCDRAGERGWHWRGLLLKIACWHVYLAGTVLAILRMDVPYVPTPKRAARGRFWRLAWPSLALIALFTVTLVRVLYTRLRLTPEGALELGAEATWSMVAFAAMPVLSAAGALYAAFEARHPPRTAAWDVVPVEHLGGDA